MKVRADIQLLPLASPLVNTVLDKVSETVLRKVFACVQPNADTYDHWGFSRTILKHKNISPIALKQI